VRVAVRVIVVVVVVGKLCSFSAKLQTVITFATVTETG